MKETKQNVINSRIHDKRHNKMAYKIWQAEKEWVVKMKKNGVRRILNGYMVHN